MNEKYQITCTTRAIEAAKQQLLKKNNLNVKGIRIGLRGGGCNGFSIIMEFVDLISEKDHIFTFDDVSFYVDAKSIVYLNNTEIDYEKSLLGSGFKFNIPQKKSSCSCGSSITF